MLQSVNEKRKAASNDKKDEVVNPRPDGVFPNPAHRWGGAVSTPRSICQGFGPILDIQMVIDDTEYELFEYIAKSVFYFNFKR